MYSVPQYCRRISVALLLHVRKVAGSTLGLASGYRDKGGFVVFLMHSTLCCCTTVAFRIHHSMIHDLWS